MGYKRVKTGVKQYKIRYNFYARKKKGERREKKFVISCFFAKHIFEIFRFLDFEIFRFLDFEILRF